MKMESIIPFLNKYGPFDKDPDGKYLMAFLSMNPEGDGLIDNPEGLDQLVKRLLQVLESVKGRNSSILDSLTGPDDDTFDFSSKKWKTPGGSEYDVLDEDLDEDGWISHMSKRWDDGKVTGLPEDFEDSPENRLSFLKAFRSPPEETSSQEPSEVEASLVDEPGEGSVSGSEDVTEEPDAEVTVVEEGPSEATLVAEGEPEDFDEEELNNLLSQLHRIS